MQVVGDEEGRKRKLGLSPLSTPTGIPPSTRCPLRWGAGQGYTNWGFCRKLQARGWMTQTLVLTLPAMSPLWVSACLLVSKMRDDQDLSSGAQQTPKAPDLLPLQGTQRGQVLELPQPRHFTQHRSCVLCILAGPWPRSKKWFHGLNMLK